MAEMSKEYGTALFMLAKEADSVDEYEKALEMVLGVFCETPEYIDFIASPAVPLKERTDALGEAFGESCPEHIVSFLCLLCERGRIREFADCVEEYKKLAEFSRNILTAHVKSAVELSENEKEKLKQKLEKMSGHSVIVECEQDEALIGGLVIEMDDKILDYSLKRRLHEVKDVISR